MSNKFKEIGMKNCTCYFFDDMINKKIFNPNKRKKDAKSYRNILIYRIGYVTIKDLSFEEISSGNSSYLIINKINGCIKENNGNNYLAIVPTICRFRNILQYLRHYTFQKFGKDLLMTFIPFLNVRTWKTFSITSTTFIKILSLLQRRKITEN